MAFLKDSSLFLNGNLREEMEGTAFKLSLPLLIRILANLGQQRLKNKVVQENGCYLKQARREGRCCQVVGSSIPRAQILNISAPLS